MRYANIYIYIFVLHRGFFQQPRPRVGIAMLGLEAPTWQCFINKGAFACQGLEPWQANTDAVTRRPQVSTLKCRAKKSAWQSFNCQALSVPRAGVEPARVAPLVFETSASTDSAIWAASLCPIGLKSDAKVRLFYRTPNFYRFFLTIM